MLWDLDINYLVPDEFVSEFLAWGEYINLLIFVSCPGEH